MWIAKDRAALAGGWLRVSEQPFLDRFDGDDLALWVAIGGHWKQNRYQLAHRIVDDRDWLMWEVREKEQK